MRQEKPSDVAAGRASATQSADTPTYRTALFPITGYFVRHDKCGSDTLVVTFETAGGNQYRPHQNRPGWGAPIIRRLGYDGLYVMPAFVDWYRQPSLPQFLDFLGLSGFFKRYRRIVTYGSSMGGFGALAYSTLCRAQEVVAFNPQSTLSKAIVPWEDRFPRGEIQDWNGPYSDAAGHINPGAHVRIFIDPFTTKDYLHAKRMADAHPGTEILKLPFAGHEVANALRDLGMLSGIAETLLSGRFDSADFYRQIRARRSLDVYRKQLDRALAHRAHRARNP